MYIIYSMLFVFGDDIVPILLFFDFIILILSKFFIKIVITVFGWATGIFFGRFSDKWKTTFYIMMVLSFVWLFFIAAEAFPAVLNVFSDYIPKKANVIWNWVIVFCIIAIPPLVGLNGARVNGISRDDKKGIALWLLKGYRISAVLSVSVTVMLFSTVIIRLKRLLGRVVTENMTLYSCQRGKIYIMNEIIKALKLEEIYCVKKKASGLYSIPYRMLKKTFEEMFGFSAERELYIAGEGISIYLNARDIMLEGESALVDKARKAIVKYCVGSEIYLTETAVESEEKVKKIYKSFTDGIKNGNCCIKEMCSVFKSIEKDNIGYDEWRVISAQICAVYNLISDKNGNYKK